MKSTISDRGKVALRPLTSNVHSIAPAEVRKKLSLVLVSNRIDPDSLETPFFVIATRGNLHVVRLCLKYLPVHEDCVVVPNGLESWERKWAFRNLAPRGFVIFPFQIDHGMVIDYLVNWIDQPLGLLDFDCFVFDQDCFKRIKHLPDGTVINSYFSYYNGVLGMAFPETIFLFINTPEVRRLKKRYGLSSLPVDWSHLPGLAREKLMSIGLSAERLPEEYKPYFDTLRALLAISLAEHRQFSFPDTDHELPPAEVVFHVGAVASVPLRGVRMGKWDAARGAYFWYRALESTEDIEIREKYYQKYGYLKSQDLLRRVPQAVRGMFERNNFLSAVERTVNSDTPTHA